MSVVEFSARINRDWEAIKSRQRKDEVSSREHERRIISKNEGEAIDEVKKESIWISEIMYLWNVHEIIFNVSPTSYVNFFCDKNCA